MTESKPRELPSWLAKRRDELCEEQPPNSYGPYSSACYKRGFDACFAALMERAPKWEEMDSIGEYDRTCNQGAFKQCLHMARWQHQQMSAQIAARDALLAEAVKALEKIRRHDTKKIWAAETDHILKKLEGGV